MKQHRQTTSDVGIFEAGKLWGRLRATSARALGSGELEPVATDSTFCEDRGIRFLIREVSHLKSKPCNDDDHNPFLPYEKPLHVADASKTHACILNKYNVVDLHLLIITRAFEHQETLLTRRDFAALWRCLHEYESLGFYNSGTVSGASQKHKHLQLVPLPLTEQPSTATPSLDALLDAVTVPPDEITRVDVLPFRHALVRWNGPQTGDVDRLASRSLSLYRRMLSQTGIDLPQNSYQLVKTPYNLIVTRKWMLLVPRLRECFGTISLNALAFVGALLVQDQIQLKQLLQAGPSAALRAVTDI